MFVIDLRGIIVDANDAARAFFFQNHSDCIGTDIYEFMESNPSIRPFVSQRKQLAEKICTTKKGTVFDTILNDRIYRISVFPLFSSDGEVIELFIVKQDITPQEQIKSELLRTQSQLDFTLESCNIGTWSFDLTSGAINLTKQQSLIFGYDPNPSDWTMTRYFEHIIPEDQPRMMQFVNDLVAQPANVHVEYRIRRADGQIRWVRDIGGLEYDDRGTALRVRGVTIDITDRKSAEETLDAQRLQWDFASQSCRLGLWKFDLDTLHLIRNNEHDRIFGVHHDSGPWTTRRFIESIIPEDQPRIQALVKESYANSTDQNFECRIRHSDGTVRWISVTAKHQFDQKGKATHVLGITQDITTQKHEESKHRDLFSLLNRTLEKCHIGIWSLELPDGIVTCSQEFNAMFGYRNPPEKWSIRLFLDHIIPEDQARVEKFMDKSLHGTGNWVIEYRIRRADGEIRWIQDIGSIELDTLDNKIRIVGLVRDITDQKNTEKALGMQQLQLDIASQSCRLGVWKLKNDTLQSVINAEYARIFGYDPDTAVPWSLQKFLQHVVPDDRARTESIIRSAIANNTDYSFECRIKRVDGAIRWLNVIAKTLAEESHPPDFIIGVLQDITEQKEQAIRQQQMQEQLQQLQKMELLGQLAGGIAHDFNNVLAAIQGNTELILTRTSSSDPFYQNLTSITHSVNRSAEMVRELLAFARKQPAWPKNIDLDAELDKMQLMLRKLIREEISLNWKLQCPDTLVNLDPANLVQIVSNLCVNARDAIASNGSITLDTSIVNADSSDELQHVACGTSGKYVSITVSDTGSGIDPQAFPHIFEPFFTTKGVGKGTGLGLSMVYGLVKQNNGYITCQTEIGKGTTFRIWLPIVSTTKAPVDKPAATVQPEANGKIKILVVEDEPDIARIIKTILDKEGCNVIMANTAEDALSITDTQKKSINLTISDIILPGMNGVQMSKELQRHNPNMKFLFMSGYSAETLGQYGKFSENTNFISKPFKLNRFVNLVHEVLKKTERQAKL